MKQLSDTQRTAAIGDVLVLVLLTVVGFATHLALSAFGRLIVTAVGSLLAWAVVAPFLGVYEERNIEAPAAIWRVALAAVLAAPLATFLRGMALNRDIPWAFILVTMLTSAFSLLVWRISYGWVLSRRGHLVRDL
jgi:FlaA1/EpsC-like NDP-sugar epimerase